MDHPLSPLRDDGSFDFLDAFLSVTDDVLVAEGGAAPAAPALRCLDASHAPGCTACTAPPSEADAAAYCLTTAREGSGLKQLRALLLATPEWGSDAARRDAAAAADAASAHTAALSALAAVLRARAGRDLSKMHLLFLCRLWSYRSDLWCRQGDCRRKRRRPVTAAPPPPASQPQRALACPPAAGGDLQLVLDALGAQFQRSAHLISAPAFRAASQTCGLGTFLVGQHQSLGQALARDASSLPERLSAQSAWTVRAAAQAATLSQWRGAEAQDGAAAADALAFLSLAISDSSPAERALAQHRQLVAGAVQLILQRQLDAGEPNDSWPQSLLVLFREMEEAVHILLDATAACELLLAEHRARGTIASFSDAGAGLLRVYAAAYEAVAESFALRSEWSREMLQRGVQPLPEQLHRSGVQADRFFPVLLQPAR